MNNLKNIPHQLLNRGIQLKDLKLEGMAWAYQDIMEVLSVLYSQGAILLGGDVLRIVDNKMQFTYDSWYHNIDEQVNNQENTLRSFTTAKQYIEDYHKRNGDKFFYTIVFKIDSNRATH